MFIAYNIYPCLQKHISENIQILKNIFSNNVVDVPLIIYSIIFIINYDLELTNEVIHRCHRVILTSATFVHES